MRQAVVDQRHKTFVPHVSVVTVGTTVQFPNNDDIFHNVFAYFEAKKFDLGMYPRGATKTVRFDTKGVVALLCNKHSEMSAYILVVDTPYSTVSDKDGKFMLKNVPPGEYTLKAWHESGSAASQVVKVTARETRVNVSIARKYQGYANVAPGTPAADDRRNRLGSVDSHSCNDGHADGPRDRQGGAS